MKKTLVEELERIHSITYGKKVLEEQGILDKMLSAVGLKDDKSKKIDDPKKADLVSTDVEEFFNTLKKASEGNGITQQEKGSMNFQKEVESMQIGLILLGYELPKYGVDGLFGPETAAAVRKFKSENLPVTEAASELRTTIDSLGYDEKGNALTSGGDITDQISSITSEILKQYKEVKPNVKVVITSGNDQHHQKKSGNSRHKMGQAVDLVIQPYNSENAKALINILNQFSSKDNKFTYIDEYTNPSKYATGGHFHLQYGERKGSTSSTMEQATPEMLKKLIEMLKQRGVKSEELKQLIDMSKTIGSLQGLSASDFDKMMKIIIDKVEGGYYHPDMLKDGRVKDSRYGNSGETMFGIDRKAGDWERRSSAGREFFALLDSLNARSNWKYNYMGGENRPKLEELATQMIKEEYISNAKRYLSKESLEIVNSSPKLIFNFIYATYNGSGWFQRFANIINREVSSGVTDPEELSRTFIDARKNSNNSLIAQSGRKIEKIVGTSMA